MLPILNKAVFALNIMHQNVNSLDDDGQHSKLTFNNLKMSVNHVVSREGLSVVM